MYGCIGDRDSMITKYDQLEILLGKVNLAEHISTLQ
jgi:hypothetical protein